MEPPPPPPPTRSWADIAKLNLSDADPRSFIRGPNVLSPLEKLPAELATMILNYVPEAVFNLKLTSRSMRNKVNEYGLGPCGIQLATRLHFGSDKKPYLNEEFLKEQKKISIEIYIPPNKYKLFELRLKLRDTPIELFSRLKRNNVYDGREACYKIPFDPIESDRELLIHLYECLGNRVEMLSLYDCFSEAFSPFIFESINGFHFYELSVGREPTLPKDLEDNILATIRSHNIEVFTLEVEEFHTHNRGIFLLKIGSLVRSFKLTDRNFHYRDRGTESIDWASTIVSMFSRKMDKLEIVYPTSITREDIKVLLKRLPNIKKNVWFSGPCNSLFDTMLRWERPKYVETVNDHLVEVVDGRFGWVLHIKHSSRVKEQF